MKVVSIVGARPQFIKSAPLSRELRQRVREVLVHTGQHYDDSMSGVFFRDLNLLKPDYHLGVGSGPQGQQTGEMLKRIEEVLLNEKPDWVLVYGDTNSTLAGALAAAKLHIPVAHIEAGLRSHNRRMPEEINRVMTDHLSSLLFCPTETAVRNLAGEGIVKEVHYVGDVMYDALLDNFQVAERASTVLSRLHLDSKQYVLATVHRAENTDDPSRLQRIVQGLVTVAEAGYKVVFPVHPRTRKQLATIQSNRSSKLMWIDPLSYFDMLLLESKARVILTDSGGVQKEAFWLRVPCVTLREETEWVETVESGWNRLVGTDTARIVSAVQGTNAAYASPWPWAHGEASRKVASVITQATAGI